MQLPPYKPAKMGPRVDLQEPAFRNHVWQHGVDVIWEQAAECPCSRKTSDVAAGLSLTLDTTATTGDKRTDCPVCEGRGYYWHSPQQIVAQVTGLSTDPQARMAWGESAAGMAEITTLGENMLAFRDRVTVLNSAMVYREHRKRAGLVDTLRFPIITRELVLSTGAVDVSVLHARRASLAGSTTAGGADVLTEGVDFDVVGGAVDWTKGDANGKAPVVGARYAMAYYARPRYVVTDFPFSMRDATTTRKQPTGTQIPTHLPVCATAKLEFLGGIANGY